MPKWVKYPENKPSQPERKVTWYTVKLDDGSTCKGCWFLNVWYCFGEWYRIVEYLDEDISSETKEVKVDGRAEA